MSDPDAPLPPTQPARTGQYTPDTRGGESTSTGGEPALPQLPGYELLGVLGRGGMGVVYKARDTKLNRVVAVKTILASPDDRVTVARFWAEAEAMAAVKHPHVAQVFELGEHAGMPFMAMEYLSGGSLAQWPNGRPLPPRAAAELVEAISRGVNAAHELGIVHRDLKPGNVLLDESGAPKVTDFGLAKRDTRDDLTRTGAVMGTPSYMSPEQAGGRSKYVGPQADVWALGVILYEALTGARPFVGDGAPDVFQKIVSAEPASVRSLNRAVPHDLATVAARCLTKEPTGRYATAGELAADLRRYLDGLPVLARPVSPLGRAKRWCRRNPVVTGLLVFLAGAFVTSVWSWWGAVASAANERAARGAEEQAKLLARDEQGKAIAAAVQAARDRDAAYRERAVGLRNEALMAGERGDGARTLLLLARAVEFAKRASDAALSTSLRTHFDAWRLTVPPIASVFTAEYPVRRVAVSSDGGFALVGSGTSRGEVIEKKLDISTAGGEARLWDLRTGKPASPVFKHEAPVVAVAFRPDGLWTLDFDGQARLWDAATGAGRLAPYPRGAVDAISTDFQTDAAGNRFAVAEISGRVIVGAVGAAELPFPPLEHGKPAFDVRFSPDGTRIAVQYGLMADGAVRLWDTATGKPVGGPIAAPRGAQAIAFHPDGPLLVGGGDGRVRFYDANTGAAQPTVLGHDGTLRAIAVSANGRRVVGVGSGARVWVLGGKKGEPTAVGTALLSPEPWLTMVAFAPDGRTVVVTRDDNLRRDGRLLLYDTASRTAIGAALQMPALADQLLFTPDGRSLLARTKSGMVYQFALPVVPTFGTPKPNDKRLAEEFAPDGSAALLGHGNSARVYDPVSGQPLGAEIPLPGDAWRAAFRPDGRRVAVATRDGRLVVCDAPDWKPIGPPLQAPRRDPKSELDWPDGLQLDENGRIAVEMFSGHVGWWPTGSGDPVSVTPGDSLHAHAFALSPDGRLLLADTLRAERAVGQASFQLWALDPIAKTAKPHGGPILTADSHVTATAWRPDGQQVAIGTHDGAILLWNAVEGKAGPTVRHAATPHVLRYTPDGKRLFSCVLDGTARLWDATTGKPLGPLMRHSDACYCSAVSPDGRTAAVGTSAGALQFWELATGKPLGGPRPHPDQVNAVVFAAGGRKVATIANDGRGRTFDAPTAFPGTPAALMRAAERHTGQALDEQDEVTTLSPAEWAAR